MLKRYSSHILFGFSVVIAAFLFLDLENYSHVDELRDRLDVQQRENRKLKREVGDLKSMVTDLHRDERLLEKVARDELGMAKPDELIFFFEEDGKLQGAVQPEHEKGEGHEPAQ